MEIIKEQAITDIAENLGISKEYVKFDENKEIYTIKDNNNLKKIHIKKFNCKLYEQYNLSFTKCVFECEIKDTRGLSLNIGNKIFFLKCDFENKIIFFNLYFKNISFILCNFKNETTFQACTFKTFCNFESSIFEHFISFDQSTFLDKVSFYNTYFYKLPHFSRVTFKGDLIATNINLNFDFDELESKIRKGDINFIEYRIKQDEKPLDKFANDFRDSFRTFKNALIKDNNLLDASNFHKYELYCKEIELNSKKPKKFSKEWLDKYQLMFYRKLCDHHTNLILNLKWLIYVIALYILLLGKIFFMYPLCIVILMVCKYFFKIKNIKVFVSLAIIFMSVCSEPKLIFGVSNLFLDDLNWWQNLVTAIYILTIALVLFSLQKTARKNSIVPS
ncbi:pentapeptide repeat-containing protein [Campylobacter sp. LH-2024]|uniref:pentapeptide repeat-containing protein n=1 Tax=Campylobacter sp. LH-2024 TaxID=3239825 RepID=UPI003AA7F2B5